MKREKERRNLLTPPIRDRVFILKQPFTLRVGVWLLLYTRCICERARKAAEEEEEKKKTNAFHHFLSTDETSTLLLNALRQHARAHARITIYSWIWCVRPYMTLYADFVTDDSFFKIIIIRRTLSLLDYNK